jgi:hypothetical protein
LCFVCIQGRHLECEALTWIFGSELVDDDCAK